MKILFMYRDYRKRRKQYGEMLERLGHDVDFLYIKEKKIKNQITAKHIKKYNPDMIWLYSAYYVSRGVISEDALDYIKNKKILMASYCTADNEVPYTDNVDVWSKFDYLFLHYKPMADFLRTKGVNAYYSPLGFYPDQYYRSYSPNKSYDVSFHGTALRFRTLEKDKRVKYLESLGKFKTLAEGSFFPERIKNKSIKVKGKYKGHEYQRLAYSKSKINLGFPFMNCPHPFYEDQIYPTNRLFEIPATGNFLLTIKCPEFLDIYPEDAVGYYDDNIESLQENVAKFLKDKETRKKMAENAYKIVQDHTYFHRFKEINRIITS